MDYAEIKIDHITSEEELDILTAWLLDRGFDSFVEEGQTLLAYIPLQDMDESWLEHGELPLPAGASVTWKAIQDQNWNEVWESSYEPVTIAGRCLIRAPFHETNDQLEYQIIIEPKMSFGTAHHDTTALMIEQMLDMEFRGKEVLDMGCGTAVLAILASKAGAARVLAVDNDPWAYNNALENVSRNQCQQVEVKEGDATSLGGRRFDIILANINRNILLRDIPAYARAMKQNGVLLLSGFYLDDLGRLSARAKELGLVPEGFGARNDWVAAIYIKQNSKV